jgi:hypothetical protein
VRGGSSEVGRRRRTASPTAAWLPPRQRRGRRKAWLGELQQVTRIAYVCVHSSVDGRGESSPRRRAWRHGGAAVRARGGGGRLL